MNVINEVMPTSGERIEQMMQPGPDGPISMVNLLKFKENAEYEDGRDTALTGREAYQIYGRAKALGSMAFSNVAEIQRSFA